MVSFAVIILPCFVLQAAATLAVNDTSDSVFDKMYDRALPSTIDGSELEETTLLKAAVGTMGAQSMLSRGATAAYRPQLRANALPTRASNSYLQPIASALSNYRPQFQNYPAPMPVRAAQNTLKQYGISSSPLEELCLTAVASSRDVSMAAQLKPVFQSMDVGTQKKVVALAEEVAEAAQEVQLKAQDLAGATSPMGFFDPLGFSTDVPAGTLLFFREAELKHGRVTMLASVGILVAEKFHPLFGGNIDVPSYIAFQQTPLQTFWPAVLVAMGLVEFSSILAFEQPFDKFSGYSIKKGWQIKTGRLPGDFGYDPLGLKPKDEKGFIEMQNKELNNGRLAMLATAGMLAQELVTGQKVW